jgi:tetratricopeptide (TPR) repeat protein
LAIALGIFLFSSLNLTLANEEELANAFKFFKTGSYTEAIESLSNITNGDDKLMGTRYYLEGMCHNRSQRFDLAMDSFQKAISYGNKTKDLYYEYGQALFANSELEKGRKAFEYSARKVHYKIPMSYYYVAHISQILEEHQRARDSYLKLLQHQKKLPRSERDLKLAQVAQFQLSESIMVLAETKNPLTAGRIAEKKVIPLMEKSIKIIPKAPLVADIEKRIEELRKKYFLDPDLMKNGKVLSRPRWNLSFSQEAAYDSNITLSTNLPTTQATQADSFIHYSTLSGDYTWQVANRYIIKPNLKFKNTVHGDRTTSAVYKNDAYNVSGGIKTSREHMLFGQRASLIFNADYSYIAQDSDSTKNRTMFSRATTYTLGEKFKFFSAGNTSIKIKYKDYYGYLYTLNKKTKTLAMDQLIITKSGRLFILLFSGDFNDLYNSPTSSTDTYLFRCDWLAPNFWPKYTLNLAMALTITDTKLAKATRGTEKTYNPSVKVTKNVSANLAVTVGYSYTRNVSLDTTSYDYEKHVTNFELKYDF